MASRIPIPVQLKQIVSEHQFKKIGNVIVDVQTANVILLVREKLNPANISKFDKLSISKQANIAWKLVQ